MSEVAFESTEVSQIGRELVVKGKVTEFNQWRERYPGWIPYFPRLSVEVKRLTGINLAGARMPDSHLYQVDFSNSNLSHADFTGSELRRAKFAGADVAGTIFNQVDLRGVTGLKQAKNFGFCQLAGASYISWRLRYAFWRALKESWRKKK